MAVKRTRISEWDRRPWSITEHSADWWDSEDAKRTTGTDDDRVEDGWLLDGGPVEVLQRLLEEAWNGHCVCDDATLAKVPNVPPRARKHSVEKETSAV